MSDNNGSAEKPSIDELRAEIKQTRSELGETVQALAAKADVKARAKDQVEQTKQKVKAQAVEATEKVKAQAAGATGKVRELAAVAGDKVRAASDQVKDSVPDERIEQVRANQTPLALLAAGLLAAVGIILIVQGRRR